LEDPDTDGKILKLIWIREKDTE